MLGDVCNPLSVLRRRRGFAIIVTLLPHRRRANSGWPWVRNMEQLLSWASAGVDGARPWAVWIAVGSSRAGKLASVRGLQTPDEIDRVGLGEQHDECGSVAEAHRYASGSSSRASSRECAVHVAWRGDKVRGLGDEARAIDRAERELARIRSLTRLLDGNATADD
jgi:hypothetical protein